MPPPGRDRGRRPRPNQQQRSRQSGGFGPYRKDEGAKRNAGRSRRPAAEPDRATPPRPSRLRVVKGGSERAKPPRGKTAKSHKRSEARRTRAAPARERRRRRTPRDVREEILSLGGSKGPRYYEKVVKAADALARDHERDAIRILRPLKDALPDSPTVHELLGLALYRDGKFGAATRELEEFVHLTDSVEQHPVLMDCYRAQQRWRRVDQLWSELAATSPPPELATEGRIVAAGALADRDRVPEAIALLGRRLPKVAQAKEYHLRLWYALGDLEERAGNLPRARALFDRVRSHDPAFADVAERLATLG